MRKIEKDLVDAIKAGQSFKQDNTSYDARTGIVTLYRTAIAQRERGGGSWRFNLGGFNTATTRSRLSALAQAFGLNPVFTVRGTPQTANGAVPVDGWFWP